jgi:two-component system cell cycle sensor histidine kinase/response regulator CckA
MNPHPVTVLIVEDDDAVRTVLARIMETEGYRAYTAADGAEALRLLAKPVPVDLVVTDVSMPRIDGRELGAELARLYPQMPVLFITGYAVQAGDTTLSGPLLLKPFRPTALIARVRDLLSQRSMGNGDGVN